LGCCGEACLDINDQRPRPDTTTKDHDPRHIRFGGDGEGEEEGEEEEEEEEVCGAVRT
jgi:hypothetical protein